ncbi:MAG: hypothetical protein OXG42_08060 [Chloroflexi bacterium]|nr:hypothetical protein [Chloroflexota bacterium]
MTQSRATPDSELPPGWTQARIRDIIDYYDSQSEEEATAEDEAAFQRDDYTVMAVPCELVPLVQALLSEFGSNSPSQP